MKKLFLLLAAVVITLSLSACSNSDEPLENIEYGEFSTQEALVSMSYLSAGLLDTTSYNQQASLNGFSVSDLLETPEAPDTEFETELEEVNIYLEKLKGFIANGPSGLGTIENEESDREEYQYKLTVNVEDQEYLLYYNVSEAEEITGIFVIGEVEYQIEVEENTLKETCDPTIDEDCDDIEEQEEPEDEDETEHKMVLTASNGVDTIKITYKVETSDTEHKTVFKLEKNIEGIESESTIKIIEEENEFKVVIEDEDNSYTFKTENEDGEVMYKLQYEVNGVKGQVKIKVKTDEFGEEYYAYQIIEQGKNRSVDKGKPESYGWGDDDTDEPIEETEETEETEENNEI